MKENKELYSVGVLDFVTVSVEFCKYIEQARSKSRDEFVGVMCKMIPLLYLKASMLPSDLEAEGYVEHPVTEDDYNYVQSIVADIMADKNDYLDVFIDDFKYSDKPIRQLISENIADVYQAIRNFVEIYREEYEDAMIVAISEVVESFTLYWGQKLLNALRAFHDVKYGLPNE